VKRIFVGSAPFFPPLEEGDTITAVVEGISIEEVKRLIAESDEVRSYCGHEDTAEFLGVAYNRKSAPRRFFKPGCVWVGIRPVKRPAPGEELEVDNNHLGEFVGWKMTFS
jgi:hypothetical protein